MDALPPVAAATTIGFGLGTAFCARCSESTVSALASALSSAANDASVTRSTLAIAIAVVDCSIGPVAVDANNGERAAEFAVAVSVRPGPPPPTNGTTPTSTTVNTAVNNGTLPIIIVPQTNDWTQFPLRPRPKARRE